MPEMTLQVESNALAPRRSRSQLAALQAALEPRYEDVLLLVSELVTNSVRHSTSHGIDVTVKADADNIRVEVTDSGPGFNEIRSSDGLGLEIVARLADDWGFHRGERFTVWVELARSAAH